MPVPPRWRRRLRAWIRRSSIVWWTGVAGLALVTALFVQSALTASAAHTRRFGPLRLAPVVVATVEAGAVVGPADVRMEERPAATVPAGAATADDLADGATALVPLLPGEVLLSARLAPAGRRGAAALLPPGLRAVAVPGGGGRPPVTVGDRVDLLATVGDGSLGDGGAPTVLVAAGALVLDVDLETDAVTVAVPPDELPRVVFAITTGTVTLALTGP